jgi:hypothetical protein
LLTLESDEAVIVPKPQPGGSGIGATHHPSAVYSGFRRISEDFAMSDVIRHHPHF